METLVDFALEERYKSIKQLGDRLEEFSTLIEWECFRTVVGDIYQNRSEQGGRPNMGIVLMVKMLVLQSMYNLSDPELERQANDRISFMKFLGFPEKIPDQTTVWYFRERLAKTGKDKVIWQELQRQLDAKKLKIRKGTIQDATFITADPGHATVNTPRGDEAKTRRSKDGTLTKKGKKILFWIQTPYQRGLRLWPDPGARSYDRFNTRFANRPVQREGSHLQRSRVLRH